MDTGIVLVIYIVLLLILLSSGMWVTFAMTLVGIIGIYLWLPGGSEMLLAVITWATLHSFAFLVIPLFMLMGQVLYHSGLSDRLYRGVNPVVSRFPGGLLHTNIVSCGIFAAISGSTSATAATIGTVALPELKKRGYDLKMATGSLAAGGTLGPLIPPGTLFIIYGVLCGVSIGKLFMGGLIPGVMLMLLFMTLIFVRAKVQPNIAPKEEALPWGRSILRLLSIWPIVLLVVVVLGGIYLGVFTPTEAAGIGSFGALLVALGFRRLKPKVFWQSVLGATQMGCMVLFLILGAKLMGIALANLGVPAQVARQVASLGLPPIGVLILIYCFYTLTGMFMDGLAAMTLTLPIMFPVAMAMGFDPVWYGVIMVMMIEIGAITPPVGINVYVLHGLDLEIPMSYVFRGGLFFLIATVTNLALNTAFPQIALWLPGKMLGY